MQRFRTFVVRSPIFPNELVTANGRLADEPVVSGTAAARLHARLTDWAWRLAFRHATFGPLMHSRRRLAGLMPRVRVMLRRAVGPWLGNYVYRQLPRLVSCYNCNRVDEPVDVVEAFLTDRTERDNEFYFTFVEMPMLLQSFVWACCQRCAAERVWLKTSPRHRSFQRLIRSRLERAAAANRIE